MISTIEMEIALMQFLNVRQNVIVPNVSWGMYLGKQQLHECDLLVLSKNNYATEIEIKITKADLIADRKKYHKHKHTHIARLYFAVPEHLEKFSLQNIPSEAGLYIVKKIDGLSLQDQFKVNLIKQCKRNTCAIKWTDKQRLKLAHLGTMRILNLKKRIAIK